jgi:hypothetical protein
MVWELKNKGFISRGKPLILVGGFCDPLVDLIKGREPESGCCIQPAYGGLMRSGQRKF